MGHPPFELSDYDTLDRLVRDAGAGLPEIAYTYDPYGNHFTRTENGIPSVLDFSPASNCLAAIDSGPQVRDHAVAFV